MQPYRSYASHVVEKWLPSLLWGSLWLFPCQKIPFRIKYLGFVPLYIWGLFGLWQSSPQAVDKWLHLLFNSNYIWMQWSLSHFREKKANLLSSSVFPLEWRVCIPCIEFYNTFSRSLVSSQCQVVFWSNLQILSNWSSLMLVVSANYCEIILMSEEFSKLSLF